jgi:uncharacterized protein (DUF433 family)
MNLDQVPKDVTRLFLDTAPVIYFIEEHPIYLPAVTHIFNWIELGQSDSTEINMNTKLVESLAEVVNALTQEDYALFQTKLITKTIQKTAGVCGGHARVRNTRIAVWTLISLLHQGMSEDELLRDFLGLTPFDILAARSHYRVHQAEIDDLIASHHSEVDWDV